MEFAIVDIETTGSQYAADSITEIGIVITDGVRELDRYETLVNPQARIPKFIVHLTGIDEEMVADAPVFADVAKEIYSFLDGRVFVAHNVNFDYKIVKSHMERVGLKIPTKRLCTVRLSRKIIPGMPSYNLGKLSASLGLKHQNAHRAMGDAEVTAELFNILFEKNTGELEASLKANSKEATLPANLPRSSFDNLPNKPGVYYFHNSKGKIIYIGKAKSIIKRVAQHFTGKSNLDKRGFLEDIFDVAFELTGNEVVASLLEEAEIKHHWPEYNSAQKTQISKFAVYKYQDQAGNIRLGVNKISHQYKGIMQFPSLSKARAWLLESVEKFNLNASYCGMQVFDDSSVSIGEHEKNVKRFLKEYLALEETIVWTGSGRNKREFSFILMENGVYQGYGFIDKDTSIERVEGLKEHLIQQHDTVMTRRILASKKENRLRKKVIS